MLDIKHLTVKIGNKTILKDFNFTFEKGKIYAVMGHNGSGKSTLAYTIMGHPGYEIDDKTEMTLSGEDIKDMDPNERAQKGIFLSFQTPLSLSGIRVSQLIQLAMQGQKKPLEIRQQIKKYAEELKIHEELLSRSLNEGASGGEKKKMEVLQAAVLNKDVIIFDEVDTGVDVDALKSIAQFLNNHREQKIYIIITHYNRILHYLKPDKVLVIGQGELKKVGDHTLADEIEKNGYEYVLGNEV
jgi:Fe-S cluster assembly ATP-binding protein